MNKEKQEKQDSKREIKELFNKIAPSWGEVGPKYWNEFGNRLVELSNIKKGVNVLDIGVGRGASLFPAAEKVGVKGKVIGIDISEVMVKETIKEILHKNIENAQVLVMDTDKLEFNNEYFDNIVAGFIFGHCVYSENKFSEILRVLKKGGQANFSIWGIQEDQNWLHKIIGEYLHQDSEHNENKKEVKKTVFNTVEGVKEILNNSGFNNIEIHEENNKVTYKNKDEWWKEMWSNAARGVFEQIEKLGLGKIEEFKKKVFNELENFYCETGYCFNMPVIYAIAKK